MSKKLKSYTLFSGLLLATALIANPAFADENQARTPNPDQNQVQGGQSNQAQAKQNQSSQDQNSGQVSSEQTQVTPVPNQAGNQTADTTYQVTSKELTDALASVDSFNQKNKLSGYQAVTVEEGQAQNQPSVTAADQDNKAQAKAIQEQLTAYQSEVDGLPAKQDQYQKDLAAYKDKQTEYQAQKAAYDDYKKQVEAGVDAGKIEKAQGLIYKSEPNALISLEGVDQYLTKEAVEAHSSDGFLDQFNTDKYKDPATDTYKAEEFTKNNPYSGKEDVRFKMKAGDTVTATYTGLENSYYDGKKLSKVVVTYKLNNSTNNENDAIVQLFHDPTKTIVIGAQTVKTGPDNNISVTIQPTFYDDAGNPVDLSDNKAIMGLSSLNHWTTEFGDHVEKVTVGGNDYIQIPGSSVQNHDGQAYSAQENQNKTNGATFNGEGDDGWDNIAEDGSPHSKTAYYGSGAMTYKGQPFIITVGGNNAVESGKSLPTNIWFSANSVVNVPQDPGQPPLEPQAPSLKGPKVTWHKNLVTVAQEAPQEPQTLEKAQPQKPAQVWEMKTSGPQASQPATKSASLPETGDRPTYGLAAFGAGILAFTLATTLATAKRKED